MGADYYGLLGVSKTADDGEIKKGQFCDLKNRFLKKF